MTRLKNIDYLIFIPYIVLCTIGIIMVYSASANIGTQNGGSPTSYLIKQSMFVVVSLVIVFIMTRIKLSKLQNMVALNLGWGLFLAVLIGLRVVGKSINGAAGWIQLGPINIQPAEFIKYFIIIYLADVISRNEDEILEYGKIFSLRNNPIMKTYCQVIILILLILIQPDTGNATICFIIALTMILANGVSWKKSATIIGLGISAIAFGLFIVSSSNLNKSNWYGLQRIVSFSNPFKFENGSGQQLINSYYAISNGGIFGKGLGNSIQKTGYLPEPNTDFIISIMSEELGMIFVLIVLALMAILILRILLLGIRNTSTYQSLICYGVAAYLTIQVFFNFGGVIGLIPITGVTFPFISYGGSSIITLSLSIGTVLNISRRQKRQS